MLKQDILVLRPGRTSYECEVPLRKLFSPSILLSLLLDGNDAIETRVAADGYVLVVTDRCEQTLRLLILHEDMTEVTEHWAQHTAVRLKESLMLAEDARDEISGNLPTIQFLKDIAPELVLHEESENRLGDVEESSALGGLVIRQVANDVGTLVVLAYLIARRTEESLQNAILRILLAQCLDEWATLLEFTERSGMEPDVTSARILCLEFVHLGLQLLCPVLTAFLHQLGLAMPEGRSQLDAKEISACTNIIKNIHKVKKYSYYSYYSHYN